MKQELVLCLDFNPVSAFRFFVHRPQTVERGGNIRSADLTKTFSALGLNLKPKDNQLIMKRFDSNNDG